MAANVDHAAISKMALPDLSSPEKAVLASKSGLTEDKATYSDARGLDGSFKMPDLSTLQFVKGEAVRQTRRRSIAWAPARRTG